MATTALHTAATGLKSLATEIDVIANNIANTNTNGFKTQRVNFEDLMYQIKEQPGVENANGDQRPMGVQVGLGVKVAGTQYDFSQGEPVPTGNPLDVFIEGPGFFQVSVRQELGGGIAYTRAGNFTRNRDGELVLGNSEGPRLEPPVAIDEGVVDDSISISSDGTISGLISGETERTDFGQIQLANFVNPGGLVSAGNNLYIETEASGPAIVGVPGEGTAGTVRGGQIESSNVQPVRELVSLIKAQRAFELNSQVIQAADESLQVISNLRRF